MCVPAGARAPRRQCSTLSVSGLRVLEFLRATDSCCNIASRLIPMYLRPSQRVDVNIQLEFRPGHGARHGTVACFGPEYISAYDLAVFIHAVVRTASTEAHGRGRTCRFACPSLFPRLGALHAVPADHAPHGDQALGARAIGAGLPLQPVPGPHPSAQNRAPPRSLS